MEKKNYVSPFMSVEDVELLRMIANSNVVVPGEDDEEAGSRDKSWSDED